MLKWIKFDVKWIKWKQLTGELFLIIHTRWVDIIYAHVFVTNFDWIIIGRAVGSVVLRHQKFSNLLWN